ncbi:MAG TPA: M20/M25/M40 family metallo-hydrolase [Thermomicrobiales bacterium]|nr:M20/M25/M40 family metallo-hydrolase [Thermomicrobiales bacterium]
MTDETLSAIDQHITAHLDEYIDDLKALCRLPSVSAQARAIDETAVAVSGLLEKYGVAARQMATSRFPVVYGEAAGDSEATLLLYNHYDVQPAEPLELWDSDPFDPEVRDGNLYGRGVGDDKGHIVCRLAAIDALRTVTGSLPCRVKFLIEGEEEIGSGSLDPFIAENTDLLRADGCLWEFGGVDFDERPQIFAGMRGDLYVELLARTASRDAHSGLGGSMFANAAWRLTWALATLKDQNERILIPGWHDDVLPASERDMELLAALPSEEDRVRQTYGLSGFLCDASGLELKRRSLFEPTCTISGLSSGYQGPGSKTVLPAEAMAKVDFRLVPNQSAADLWEKLKRHLCDQGFGDIEIVQHGGYDAARVDPDDPFVTMVADTGWDVYDRPASIHPTSGGSGPMVSFVKHLGIPIANVGIGYPDSGAHAPNEHVRVVDFVRGIRQTARVMLRMPELQPQ